MAVSDGMTPRKSPALATWRGTPGRSPSRQVLGCGLGHTGLFARTAPPELPPSPPPPQRSHLLTPPVRGVASAQPAGEQGLRYRSHAGRNDAKSGSGAATQDTLQGGAFGIQPGAFGTPPATPASLPRPRHSMWSHSSSSITRGTPPPPQAAAQRPQSGAWSPMLVGASASGSLAAQGAGLLRLAPAGSSAADVGWQVRRGALPASGQAQPVRASSRAASAAAAAPAPRDALAELAQLRRRLRQLDPGLAVAPPPPPPQSSGASVPATAAGGRGAAARAPAVPAASTQPPPRLTSREGVQAALAQLRQHQRAASQLQAATSPVQGAAAASGPPDVRPHTASAPSPQRMQLGGADRPPVPEREPSAAASGRVAAVAAQLQRLRLLQGAGATLAGFASG